MTTEIAIRPACIDDAADVLEIEQACAEAPHWSDGVWAQILVQTASCDPRHSFNRYCLVAEHNSEVVGFLVLSLIAGSAGVAGSAEMESVAVLPFARRHGVGRSLCEQAMVWCSGQGVESMKLEVRASNVAAIGLYTSLGFVVDGRRTNYYRDPAEDAVLLGTTIGTQTALRRQTVSRSKV